MTKTRKLLIKVMSFTLALSCTLSVLTDARGVSAEKEPLLNASSVEKINTGIDSGIENYFDENVVTKLPDTVKENDVISVIVKMNVDSVVDVYNDGNQTVAVSEFASSDDAVAISENINKKSAELIKALDRSGIDYILGEKYDTLIGGFEITIIAKDFEKVGNVLGDATLIVGEVYQKAETEVVTNDVDVYDTGIFDSSSLEYQGDGVVVAVLDTGLDYTHTAFDVNNFETSNEAFTLKTVSDVISKTSAAKTTYGLKGEDVYVSRKVPYAYDYADKDSDVFPINSEHGTHVAGIIAGHDDVITGVAPNAQLAIMKVFSDVVDGAKTSWLIAALEDCVTLGVDVINMSLGSGCGFTRETDKENINEIYDKVRSAGISLIASAANSYNATFSSTKNGTNGLTSNPDSGTVGSPSTYEAALSVASVDGVKTPYFTYNGEIMYFNEATNAAAKKKNFVDDILKTVGEDVESHDFEYVTIPGVGTSSDYMYDESYYKGKIVLVKRGNTTFEDKVRVALNEKGASGIIIYNNISGTISMSVGKDIGAVCSLSQDEGEKLAAAGKGIIRISRNQVAGPFMSDFSSWGPTSDLRIKPEITAHGGEILSSVPGQNYDRLSGTSMAAPNQAGATALIRQYVKYSGVFGTYAKDGSRDIDDNDVTAIVNQLMMSTADIVYNKNGLPYAVRKQGAGLVNMKKSTTTASYIQTYDKNGNEMDKSKLELGDDKNKTGVYEMSFGIKNISGAAVSYDIGSVVITEGVSKTYTSHSDTTVTQDGYLLNADTKVVNVSNGLQDGNKVTVSANSSAKVTVKITLSNGDKAYLNKSFKHGMYVEGFVTLNAVNGTDVNVNVPLLAYYGDWTEAPIFDEEYYDTNVDEINAGKNDEDKLMADAYATRVIGNLYSDYISTLGSYYFIQNPAATQIAADKDKIAISNQQTEYNYTVNSVYSIWAGFLRNVKYADITIVEDSTGNVVFTREESNLRKSFSSGGNIYYSSIKTEFSAIDYALKNNTKYTVTVKTYIDYGSKEEQKNVRNTFEFPLYIDFEAPAIKNVTFTTEYDKTTETNKLFANLEIYDNHYAMGVQFGQITDAEPGSGYSFSMKSFGKYVTPVYSSFNSTSVVTVELTDYVSKIKNSKGIKYNEDGTHEKVSNNSFVATCYDYAMNTATYEISLPDEVIDMYFGQDDITLSENETRNISDIFNVYPLDTWKEVLDYESSDKTVADVINRTVIAKKKGKAVITVNGYDSKGNKVSANLNVKVLGEGDEGFEYYSVPEVNRFDITGYKVNKAYYSSSSSEREIGLTDGEYEFANNSIELSMFPSESVTLKYILDSYFPEKTSVKFSVGNKRIASVSDEGTITALAEGNTSVYVEVLFDGQTTIYRNNVSVKVKDPFNIANIYLMSYKGLGGKVVIPDDRGITTIYNYAFSNYEYVDKDLSAGDVIDDEDPYKIKQHYIGDNTIEEVVIPEGVTNINSYAFAALTALKKVTLPKSLVNIASNAFLGCKNLKEINLENVKFINERAFSGCALENVDLSSIAAIGNYSFEKNSITKLELPASAQSLGIGAFSNNTELFSVAMKASKIKIGSRAFEGCANLTAINVNATVISSFAFYKCNNLTNVTLGKDVAVIGEYAFAGTNVTKFSVDYRNDFLETKQNGAMLFNGDTLLLVAPKYYGVNNVVNVPEAKAIADGAFSNNLGVFRIIADNAVSVGNYAFAFCSNLTGISLNSLETIGDYAFVGTSLTKTPDLAKVKEIGNYAFTQTKITSVDIHDGAKIGNYAFAHCLKLERVTIGNDVVIGEAAFYCPVTFDATNTDYYKKTVEEIKDAFGEVIKTVTHYEYDYDKGVKSTLSSLTIGNNAVIGDYAFAGNARLGSVTLGENASIGDYAFFNASQLKEIDLSKVVKIDDYAFAGSRTQDFYVSDNQITYAYKTEVINGEEVITDLLYTSFAPKLEFADLSSVKVLGKGVFSNAVALKKAVLGENVTTIGDYLFANCTALNELTMTSPVTKVGKYGLFGTAFTSIDLSCADKIGEYAMSRSKLESVNLKDGAIIDEGAFSNCYSLKKADNLENVSVVSTGAFINSALENCNLTNVTEIGDYAFANTKITGVVLGGNLEVIGENPFFGCKIATFGKEENVTFGDKVIGVTVNENYDISDNVKVIDGALYYKVPNGLMLIAYPLEKKVKTFAVADGTVRIGSYAFNQAAIESVTLPRTLLAIGDKAFYGCSNLKYVVFTSYEAPILEEAYSSSYVSNANILNNLPFAGRMGTNVGLGIVPYYMWNITSHYNNFYFGANFVNYIGHIENKLVMVRPSNGLYYDTFILGQYFSDVVMGSAAMTDETASVYVMIEALPGSITLADENAVVAARKAYDAISSLEQQSLVTNISKLTSAESVIKYLKQRENPNPDPDVPKPTPNEGCNSAINGGAYVAILVLAAGVAVVKSVYVCLNKKKKSNG